MKKKINVRIGKKFVSIYLDTKKDANVIQWLQKYPDASNAIRDVLYKLVSNELITKAEYLKQEELLITRIQKMKAEMEYTKVKTKIALVHELHVSPDDVIAIMDGKKSINEVLSPHQTENEKIEDDLTKKALKHFSISNHRYVAGTKICSCLICKNTFEWSDEMYKTECLRHVSGMHSIEALK